MRPLFDGTNGSSVSLVHEPVKKIILLLPFLGALGASAANQHPSAENAAYPAAHWETREPEQVGLSREKLEALKELVGGHGCVVRHGYMVYGWGDQTKSYRAQDVHKRRW